MSEHHSRGLEGSLVSSTMSLLTSLNSLLAISAGLVSDLLVRQLDLPVLAAFLAAWAYLGPPHYFPASLGPLLELQMPIS